MAVLPKVVALPSAVVVVDVAAVDNAVVVTWLLVAGATRHVVPLVLPPTPRVRRRWHTPRRDQSAAAAVDKIDAAVVMPPSSMVVVEPPYRGVGDDGDDADQTGRRPPRRALDRDGPKLHGPWCVADITEGPVWRPRSCYGRRTDLDR